MATGDRPTVAEVTVIVDCADPERLAAFWGGVLGVGVWLRRGPYVFLEPSTRGLGLGFQHVEERRAGKNRVHLDFNVDDLAATVAQVQRLGGRRLPGYEAGGFLVMADPEGNEFCLLPNAAWELDETGRAHYPHP